MQRDFFHYRHFDAVENTSPVSTTTSHAKENKQAKEQALHGEEISSNNILLKCTHEMLKLLVEISYGGNGKQ